MKTIFYTSSILLVAILVCGGCASSNASCKTTKQHFRFITAKEPESLLPQEGIDQTSRVIVSSLFEGLTRPSSEKEYEWGSAKAVELSADKTRYTFHLRPSKWSDGSPLTAFDFERSWRMAVACDSLFPRAEAFYIIKNAKAIKRGEKPLSSFGAKALDASTFVVELNHPSPYFLNLISTTFFAPFQEGKQEVGNGPFRVKSKEPGASITLEKNPNYWDASSVRLEEVTAYFVDDAETGLMLFEKGEVDWVGSPFRHLPLDAIPHLRASQELHTLPVSIVYWLSVNTKDPLLSNVKLRRALSLALDREKLVEGVLVEQVPSFSVIPTNLRDKTPTNSFVKEDPLLVFEEALEELKLTRQELSPLVLKHSNVPGQKKLCEALQQVWEETFKIKIQLQGADWNTFFSDLQGRQFQIGGCLWRSLYDDPMGILEFFKEGKSPYNPSGWENQEYKRLLTLADNEVDERQREHHLKHAEALLFCDVPVIPLYSELFKYAKKEYVKGVYITNGGDVDLKNAFIAP